MAKIKCPKCGTEMEEGSRFCTSCGYRLGASAAGASAAAAAAAAAAADVKNEIKASADAAAAAKADAAKADAAKAADGSEPKYKPLEPVKFEGTASIPKVEAKTDGAPSPEAPASAPAPAQATSAFDATGYSPVSQNVTADVPAAAGRRERSDYPRPEVKISRTKPQKKQTAPERILNIIASLLLCFLIAVSALMGLACGFADRALTPDGVQRIVSGIDVTKIMIEGKTFPETIVNAFGLDYGTLGLIGVTEESINKSFSSVTALAASRLGEAAGMVREGKDIEDFTLVTRGEIMDILKDSGSDIIGSIPVEGLSESIYDIIDQGLINAGYGDGLTVRKTIDSMGEARAAETRKAIQSAHAAIKALNFVMYGFFGVAVMLVIVLFILNKRRLRASFFWLFLSCAAVSASMLAIHFNWIRLRSVQSVAGLTEALQPIAVDYTLKYGVVSAAAAVISLALCVVCAVVGARRKAKRGR